MSESEDFRLEGRSALQSFFSPKSVAVIGATDRKETVGRTVLENLLSRAFRTKTEAVNPNRNEVLGLRSYNKIADVPEKIDLVIVESLSATRRSG